MAFQNLNIQEDSDISQKNRMHEAPSHLKMKLNWILWISVQNNYIVINFVYSIFKIRYSKPALKEIKYCNVFECKINYLANYCS